MGIGRRAEGEVNSSAAEGLNPRKMLGEGPLR